MRNIIVSLAIAMAALPAFAANSVKATVNGMVCAFCAQGIEKTIAKIYPIPELDNFLGDRLRDGR